MSLTLRTITNAGAPLCMPSGQVVVGATITFSLVDSIGMPASAFDAISQEDVGSQSVTATTDAGGEFSVQIWPTSRADRPVRYRCTVTTPDSPPYTAPPFAPFTAQLADGVGALSWALFAASGTALTPQELSALSLIMNAVDEDRAAAQAAREAAESASSIATGAAGTATADAITAANASAAALVLANYKGAWESLTGPLAIPASVIYNNQFFMLLSTVSNVAAHVPGVSIAWGQIAFEPYGSP